MTECQPIVKNLIQNMKKVIRGKDDQIRKVLCCWFAGGHILLEDFPGTGKTMLARALAKSAQVEFKRVQFTPDLLPSDILGASVYSQKKGAFEFLRGPMFTTLFLGDEINRATPRTQSALLESMAENQVTTEGITSSLNPLFFVIATQNPLEQHGTFPLPEAQLDRFLMKISMGYPKAEEEIEMIKNQNETHPISRLEAVETEARVKLVRDWVPKVVVGEPVYKYVIKLVNATRKHKELEVGASPRATIGLIRAAQAMAIVDGLSYVNPTHVQQLASVVLAHRMAPTAGARLAGRSPSLILESILAETPVPVA